MLELDLPDHMRKDDLQRATGVDTSNLATKSNFASIKDEVDKTGINKLKTVPAGLSK